MIKLTFVFVLVLQKCIIITYLYRFHAEKVRVSVFFVVLFFKVC